MDVDAFKALLDSVTFDMKSSGTCTHAHLLALGLIARDLHTAVSGPADDPFPFMSDLTQDHVDAFLAVMADLAGICRTKSSILAVAPSDCARDSLGYIWPKHLPIMTGEAGSPAVNAGDNKTSIAFFKSLCSQTAYQHALLAGGYRDVQPAITNMVSLMSISSSQQSKCQFTAQTEIHPMEQWYSVLP